METLKAFFRVKFNFVNSNKNMAILANFDNF